MALVKPKRATAGRQKAVDKGEVIAGLASGDVGTRRTAIRQAIELGAGVELLVPMLPEETDAANLDLIFAEITRMKASEAIAILSPLLGDHNPERRNKATECLHSIGAPAVEALRDALRDPDPDVRIQALSAVPNLEQKAAQEILLELIEAESEENVIACAVEALVELGDASALPTLENLSLRADLPPSLAFAVEFAIDRLRDARP